MVLALAFELLDGHYLFGNPWNQLLDDYDVLRGRIWILVLVTTAIAPQGLPTLPAECRLNVRVNPFAPYRAHKLAKYPNAESS